MNEERPLAGARVLEWAQGIAGPIAGWLLAEAGAEVLKLERPDGDRLRGAPGFHVVNRGKRGLVVDPADPSARPQLERLYAAADVVIVDEAESELETLGLGYDASRYPSLVWCSLPLFGREGPRSGLPPDDALVEAASGIAAMQWSYGKSPVCLVTPIASYATGFLAALGIASALHARFASGRGQRIDTSGLAGALLLQSGTYVTGAGHEGSFAAQADDPRGVFASYGLYETSDGWIFVGALTEAFWVSLLTVIERTDILLDPLIPANPMAFGQPGIRTRLRAELEPIFRGATTGEWLRRLGDADVPCGGVQSREEYLDEELAEATAAVIEIDDPEVGPIRQAGAPFLVDGAIPAIPSPAPSLDDAGEPSFSPRTAPPSGARRAVQAPLEGVRVLDLASFIAGPLCPMLLADLGADVMKVEAPLGDPFRLAIWGFEGWNRGKRSVVLDLKKESGREAFLRLVDTADVVVENFRGGVMETLGLGYASLAARNPRLVYTAITGFGSSGPASTVPGFDPVMQARSGFCRAQGGDDEPVLHQVAYTDYMAGTLGAYATSVALLERERTGRGRHVDVSLYRTAFAIQAAEIVEIGGHVPEAKGGRDYIGRSAVYRAYPTKDGWIFVAAAEAGQARILADRFDLTGDPGALLAEPVDGAVAKRLAAAIAPHEKEALARELKQAGVPAAPCLEFEEVFADEHLLGAGLIREATHPRLGTVRQTGEVLRFSATGMILGRPSPALGEHGREILHEAGLSPAEIEALVRDRVTIIP